MSTQQSVVQRNILFIILPYLKEDKIKDSKIRDFIAFPYGVLSVVTYLKNHADKKVNIKIIDCNLYDYEDFVEIIRKNILDFRPDIVGLSMMFDSSYKHLKDISKIVKDNNSNIIVVLGGAAASFSYNEIINEQEYIDGICYSEGEIPFVNLINSEDMLKFLEDDKSWVTRKSIKEGKIPEKALIIDLDDTINIDYSFIDMENYQMNESFSPFIDDNNKNKKQFFLVTSRGCHYRCIFCSTSKGLYNNKIRYASIDKIIDHVSYLVNTYGMNILTIYDDQLLSNRKRAKEIFRRLAPFNLRIECPNGLTVAFIDDEMAYLMKNAGMDTIILAIESGSDYMLREIIHKPLKLDMVKPVVQILRKHKFFIEAFFLIGIPGEKEEHRDETLNFIKDVALDWGIISTVVPLRGSRLYEICIKNGYIDKNLKIGDIKMGKYIIHTPDLEPEYITKKAYLINLDVNFVNNYRMKIGDYHIAAKCFQDVINRYANHAFAYYYLANSQEAMNIDSEIIKFNKSKFYEIIKEDNTWKEYAKHFGLESI